jgi:Flp pilus assembly protein TadD
LTLLADLARREPRSPAVIELLASTLLAGGQLENARMAYARLLELAPRHDRGLFNMGMLEVQAGNRDEGVAYLERAHAVHPDDPLVLLNLGLLHFQGRGEQEAGRPYLERFLELEPDDPDAAMVRELLDGDRSR